MNRVRSRRVHDFRGATQTAFDRMTVKSTVLPNSDLVFFVLNLSADRNVTSFGFL